VIRDWNSGKISYHTEPPALHPSSIPSDAPTTLSQNSTSAADVGEAKIVKDWGMAFDLAGLFAQADKEVLEEPEGGSHEMAVDIAHTTAPSPETLTQQTFSVKRARSPSVSAMHEVSEPESDDSEERGRSHKRARLVSTGESGPAPSFDSETLASSNPLNRSKLKKDAKKARRRDKRSSAVGLAEQLGSLGMS